MFRSAPREEGEPLGVLLLPGKLEEIRLEQHARDLLSIPRVLALEPPRLRLSRSLSEGTSGRQAARLRLPGRPRLLVLYHPAQYPLARALLVRNKDAELWYIPPAGESVERPEQEFDVMARERAAQVLDVADDGTVNDAALRERLTDLGIISPYAFIPDRPRRPGRF